MKVTICIEASIQDAQLAWLRPSNTTQWLSDQATIEGDDFILCSRLVHISGRHKLIEQSDSNLIFDWYVQGFKTILSVSFVELTKTSTKITVKQTFKNPTPKCLAFPLGKYYGDDVWLFALNNLRAMLESGNAAIKLRVRDIAQSIRLPIELNAPAAKVWDALTDPAQMQLFGLITDKAVVEPKLGGRYSFGWPSEDEKIDGPDCITEWSENSVLAYSWWHDSEKATIRFHLEENDAEQTSIVFTHSGITYSYNNIWSYRLGWADYLFELKWYLEKGQKPETCYEYEEGE